MLPLNANAASDGTEDIIASDMDLDVYYASNDSDVETHITDKCNVSIWNSNDSYPEYKGFTCIRVPYQAMIGSDGHIVFLTEDLDLVSDHEYELDFQYGHLVPSSVNVFKVQLRYYDSKGSLAKVSELYDYAPPTDDPVSVKFSFKPDASGMSSGYSVKLAFIFFRVKEVTPDLTGNSLFFISNEIGFVDKDDDSGWFQKIINKIEETISNVKAIPEKINQKLAELKEGIGSFFTEQWNNIKGAFDDVGTWFVELGDKFNEAINALGEFIIDGIRDILQWAFVPSEEFMDEYIQVIRDKYEEHFGIFAQVTLFLTDTLEYIDSLMDYDYEFVFPEVSLPIAGKTYVIIEKQTVNMKQWLGSGSFGAELYSIYQTCVWAIIIFCIFKYALVVEDVIISGTSSLATKEVVRGYL